MLPAVIGLLAFGVTIPGFEAYTYWKKTEFQSNSTNHQSLTENPESRPALSSFSNQQAIPINSFHSKDNDTQFGKMYDPERESMSPSRSNIHTNKIGFGGNVFKASKLFRPRYKSLKTTCDRNVYKVYSNDEKSALFRNNYELWSSVNYFSDSRAHKIRRSEPEEFSDDSRFIFDDDYSLVNYVDNWRGQNEENTNDRGQTVKRGTLKKKKLKRDAEDKEFSVMFHSRKNHEFRDTFSNNYDFYKNGKKKSILHFEKKKYKHEFGLKPERKLSFTERRNNLKESYNHVARTTSNLKSSKKKYPFWSSKKEKEGAELESSGILFTSPKGSVPSLVPPRKVLHWATTRDYVAAISARNQITPGTLSPNAPLVPSMFLPFLNLTDSLFTARKSDVVGKPSSTVPINSAAVLVNQSGSPQYLRLGNNNLDIRSLNPNLPFPFAFNIPIAKQSEHNAAVYGPPVQITTPAGVFFFNAPTEGINPLSNHMDTFKNTTTWNAKQGPPGNLNALSSLVNLVNYQMDNAAGNHSERNIPVKQDLPFPGHLKKNQKATPPSMESQFTKDFKIDPLGVDQHAGLEVTSSPIIGAEALVNFLQNALISQNGVFNELGVGKATKAITRTTMEASNMHGLSIDNNLMRILEPTRTVLTEAAPTLALFTTEEPLMNRFSDIISRNADRKIPIVYDIEEAPQLVSKTTKVNITSLGHVLHEMPFSRIQRHIIDHRSSTKKNKTSTKLKQIDKRTNFTTPWLILTTTENMLYSEMKVQNQLESNKPKAKKINLLFKSKAKPNGTSVSSKMVSKQVGKTVKPLTSVASKERERKAVTDPVSTITKPITTEETESSTRSRCCCCCTCCNRKNGRGSKKGGRCGCSSTCPHDLTFDDSGTKRHSQPLELTTPISCVPFNISMGSISCPSCHHEFTYKLGFKNLIV